MSESAGLRVGVVGCGYWGSKHVRALRSLTPGRCACDRPEPGARGQSASQLPGSGELRVSRPGARRDRRGGHRDPPSTHKLLALEAIAAGKHVMVEKPLATTAADAREMIDAAKAQGVVLMVGHTFEYHSAVWSLREMVRSGALGDLYYLDTARLNLGLYQHDVNVLLDLARTTSRS